MAKAKGSPKTGGRKPGTTNRSTKEIREHIANIVSENIDTLNEDLQQLKPEQRIDVIIKLLPWAAPKISSIDESSLKQEGTRKSSLQETLDKLSQLKYDKRM
jgi:actin-like ATPase involved in cell morphogenesis